jgi:hypothetical protein
MVHVIHMIFSMGRVAAPIARKAFEAQRGLAIQASMSDKYQPAARSPNLIGLGNVLRLPFSYIDDRGRPVRRCTSLRRMIDLALEKRLP